LCSAFWYFASLVSWLAVLVGEMNFMPR
jgi:hypothetical protein